MTQNMPHGQEGLYVWWDAAPSLVLRSFAGWNSLVGEEKDVCPVVRSPQVGFVPLTTTGVGAGTPRLDINQVTLYVEPQAARLVGPDPFGNSASALDADGGEFVQRQQTLDLRAF